MTIPQQKSDAWHEERRKYIGGSDANIIINGSDADRYRLWQIKTGQVEPDDLSDIFQVALGSFTEPFNLAWFEKKTGFVLVEAGRFTADNGFMSCQPDGMLADAVVECKHTTERYRLEESVAKYQPQLHHSMICTGKSRAFLSVIRGNTYDYQEVEFDPVYAEKLLSAEREFWECVKLGMPPGPGGEPIKAPEPTRIVDMTGNNQWADAAAEWFATIEASKRADKAANMLRSLVPADVKSASGHGIALKRDKRNALRISEVK